MRAQLQAVTSSIRHLEEGAGWVQSVSMHGADQGRLGLSSILLQRAVVSAAQRTDPTPGQRRRRRVSSTCGWNALAKGLSLKVLSLAGLAVTMPAL